MLPTLLSNEAIKKLLLLAEHTPSGAFVEIGVYKGGSGWHLSQLAEIQNRDIYLYDTFEGLPYHCSIDKHKAGEFNHASYDDIVNAIPYATIVKGIFPNSAVEMGLIAFVHFDCDQYQSIKEGVEYLLPRMVKNGIMLFDDYNWLAGATLAVDELFGKNNLHFVGAPHANNLDRVYKII